MEGVCWLVGWNAMDVNMCRHTLGLGLGCRVGRVKESQLLRALLILARLLQALVHWSTAAVSAEASHDLNCRLRTVGHAVYTYSMRA